MRSRVKDIIVKVIDGKTAGAFVKEHHYSGSVVNSSILHFGCFLDNQLHGVMSFGSPMVKHKVMSLVHTEKNEPVKWNEMLELNRMAFNDYLPRNSESRCMAISIRLIKRNAPHIKWLLSFSDATQCGDGTIYRASGFKLTGIKKSKSIYETPWGERFTRLSLSIAGSKARKYALSKIGINDRAILYSSSINQFLDNGFTWVEGYQLRYIYLIDNKCTLNVPNIPFSKIDEIGAGMYKGENISIKDRNIDNN